MKQINSSDYLTVGSIKLEANKQSQHADDGHKANSFYCGFSPTEANGEIYWTFNINNGRLYTHWVLRRFLGFQCVKSVKKYSHFQQGLLDWLPLLFNIKWVHVRRFSILFLWDFR